MRVIGADLADAVIVGTFSWGQYDTSFHVNGRIPAAAAAAVSAASAAAAAADLCKKKHFASFFHSDPSAWGKLLVRDSLLPV